MRETIENQNDLIRKFMGFNYHERVDIDYSECGGIYTRTDVYCKHEIEVNKYPDDNQFYLKDYWTADYDNVIYGKLKYHSSMDWLLPVISKIESMGYQNTISYRHGGQGNFHEMLFYDIHLDYLSIIAETFSPGIGEEDHIAIAWINEAEKKTKLEAVHRAVVNFIKYYNAKEIKAKLV